MSTKIDVSYTTEQELDNVIQLLKPIVKSWKKKPAKGKFKRAYIELENRDEVRAKYGKIETKW